jgi:hypothetical protein
MKIWVKLKSIIGSITFKRIVLIFLILSMVLLMIRFVIYTILSLTFFPSENNLRIGTEKPISSTQIKVDISPEPTSIHPAEIENKKKTFGNILIDEIYQYAIKDTNYYIVSESLYYQDESKKYFEIKDFDFSEYIVVNEYIIKNSTKALYKGVVIDGIDSNTLEVLNEFYLRDKFGLYALEDYGTRRIKLVDMQSFKLLEGVLWKDKNGLFIRDFKLEDIDLETLECLSMYYLKDQNGVYYVAYERSTNEYKYAQLVKINSLDLATVIYLGEDIFRDKNGLYNFQYNGGQGDLPSWSSRIHLSKLTPSKGISIND